MSPTHLLLACLVSLQAASSDILELLLVALAVALAVALLHDTLRYCIEEHARPPLPSAGNDNSIRAAVEPGTAGPARDDPLGNCV